MFILHVFAIAIFRVLINLIISYILGKNNKKKSVYSSQLVSRFYRNLMSNDSLTIVTDTIGEIFSINFKFEDVRKEVEELLK